MAKKNRPSPTADRYIEATLTLIAEHGGATQVNLREISRRIGCAHTNAYNYFEGREDLMLHALRRVLRQYGDAITAGLDDALSGHAFFRKMIRNMIEWSIQNPGLHRFLSSDPIDPEKLPDDIIETVTLMKKWIAQVLEVLACGRLDEKGLARMVDVVLGYLDGEVFNLINGRFLPGEDIAGRVIDNIESLFELLTAHRHDGLVLSEQTCEPVKLKFPKMEI
jgi:AcrR family transcriptional regulator